jgi:hypothetical protein
VSRLYTTILARNEAGPDRYLTRVLSRCKDISTEVLLLDDRSTDSTPEIARELGCIVRTRKAQDERMWGNEAPARAQLWDFALEYATESDDWVLICDADMELHGDPRPLCETLEANTWMFILYDLWSETEYRSDQFWQGHEHPRPWLFAPRRVPEGYVAEWNTRGIHTGHCPLNFPISAAIAPISEYYFLHLAYSTPRLRAEKHAQYMSRQDLLSPFEVQHAASILDLDPAS